MLIFFKIMVVRAYEATRLANPKARRFAQMIHFRASYVCLHFEESPISRITVVDNTRKNCDHASTFICV